MRKFNWDTIPCERVLGRRNLWTIQASLDNFELDTERIKELFGNKDSGRPRMGTTVTQDKTCDPSSSKHGAQKVSYRYNHSLLAATYGIECALS